MYGNVQVLENNNIKRKRTALQISVSYINDNSGMRLPFNIPTTEQEWGSCC